MVNPVVELAAVLASSSNPEPEALETQVAAVGNYFLFESCPDDLLLDVANRLGRAMDSRPATGLAAAAIRLSFGVFHSPANFLLPDSLSPVRREIVERLRTAISVYEQAVGNDALLHYYHGACEYWRRNIEGAYARFNQSRLALPAADRVRLDQIGVCGARPLDEIARLAKREAALDRPLTLGRCEPAPFVVVACADDHYLARYGHRLRDSLAPFGDVRLHVHVATDAPGAIGPFLGDQVNFSYEPKPQVVTPRYYYQSMRFMRAVELLDLYRRPLLFVDVDVEFTDNPARLFALIADCHVGLNNNRRAYVPWRKFNGQCVYIDPTTRGLRYARDLRNLVVNLYAPDLSDNFWLDQFVLAHAVEAVTIHCEGVNIVDNRSTGWAGLWHK